MITVINFSHPLSDAAREKLPEVVGAQPDDIIVHHIPVHIQDMANVRQEVQDLLAQAVFAAGGNHHNVDCIIPPGHGLVSAAMVATMAKTWRYLPNLIVMASEKGALTPKFLPVGLVRGGTISGGEK